MDPLGHLAPWLFKDMIRNEDIDIRPTIAVTKAHMKLPELEQSVRTGRLVPDGKICLNELGELAVTKFAVEPVWYLPGVAERFGIGQLRIHFSLHIHLVFLSASQVSLLSQYFATIRRRYSASIPFRKYRWILPGAYHQR